MQRVMNCCERWMSPRPPRDQAAKGREAEEGRWEGGGLHPEISQPSENTASHQLARGSQPANPAAHMRARVVAGLPTVAQHKGGLSPAAMERLSPVTPSSGLPPAIRTTQACLEHRIYQGRRDARR